MLTPYIGKKILEIGCGIGNLTYYLQRFSDLSCLDISEFYLAHARIDYPNIKFYEYDITDEQTKTLKANGFDTVICVNVLEHINNDKKALQNIFEILQPGGRIILYVPALQFLYGSVDKHLSHFRRYNRRQLESLLTEAGFKVEKLFYSNFIGIFGWFMNGKIQKRKELSYWQVILFDKFIPIVEKIEKYVTLPCGLSLFAVAKKYD